jgi:erythromycin esterase-like protein
VSRARWHGLIAASVASIVLLPPGPIAHAQDGTPPSIVDAVVKAACEKQIVLLGEPPSHGEAQAFDAKSRIVDRLISQCGFTAVLFEAPVFDFVGFERSTKTGAATPQQLDDAIGRFWLTRELAPWRRALFDAATTKRLTVGGIDDQSSITSHYAMSELPRLIAAASSESDAAACRETVSRHLGYTYDATHPFDDPEKLRLQQCARNAAAAAAATRFDASDRVMLDSFARYADRQNPGATVSRDESMFLNLAWYVDRLAAKSRVVVWTATVHAARQRGSMTEVPVGARAVERWGDRVASVGFTMYGGFTSRAARPASPIPDAPAESLEAAATKESDWALLDSGRLRTMGAVSSRLLGRFFTETWSDYFDAVVVIRQERAPTFDPWKR